MFISIEYNMELTDKVTQNERVLLVWSMHNDPESVKQSVEVLSGKVGSNGKVQVENRDRLLLCKKHFFIIDTS